MVLGRPSCYVVWETADMKEGMATFIEKWGVVVFAGWLLAAGSARRVRSGVVCGGMVTGVVRGGGGYGRVIMRFGGRRMQRKDGSLYCEVGAGYLGQSPYPT